jgi:PAS domain S-box-containing protein
MPQRRRAQQHAATRHKSHPPVSIAPTMRRAAWWVAIYLASGAIVIALQPNTGASLWYPPIAFGMVFLARSGLRWFPALFFCDFLLSLHQYQAGAGTAAVVAANTTLEILLGAYALRRIHGDQQPLDFWRYLAVAGWVGIIATGVGASLGSLLLARLSAEPTSLLLESWGHWWLGDATAVLCLLPLFLLWQPGSTRRADSLNLGDDSRHHAGLELTSLQLSAVVVAIAAGQALLPQATFSASVWHLLAVLPLLWAALRFPAWVSSLVIAELEIFTVLTVWLIPRAHAGKSAMDNAQLVDLQIFMIAIASAGVALALALAAERTARHLLSTALDDERRLHRRLTAMPAMIYAAAATPPYGATFISSYSHKLLGYSPQEFVDDPQLWISRIHPHDQARLSEWLQDHGYGRRPRLEFRFRHRDGHYLWLLDDSELLRDEQGRALENVGIWTDISELRNTELTLRESEQRYADAFAGSVLGMTLVGLDHRFIKVNRAFCQIVGRSSEELLTMSVQDLTHPDDLASTYAEMARVTRGETLGSTTEKRYLHASGTVVWAQVSQTVVRDEAGRPLYRVAQILDITARKEAQAGREAEAARAEAGERANSVLLERLNETQALANIGSWTWALANDAVWWSDEMYRILGTSRERCVASIANTLHFIHGDDRVDYEQAVARVLTSHQPLFHELRIVAQSGQLKYCQVRAQVEVEVDAAGQATRLFGSVQDISVQRSADAEVEVVRQLLAEAERLTQSGAARWHVDSDEWVFSEGWSRLQGSPATKMNSAELSKVVHPDDRGLVNQAMQAVRAGSDYDVEHRIVRFDDGETRWVVARGALRVDEQGRRVLYTAATDVTERRQMEARIQESQKLEAVGMLAGGIAHDFNNLLSVILGNVHLARRAPDNAAAMPGWLAAIDDASRRGKAVVEQILAFSRQQPQRLGALELAPLIDEVWTMLRAAIPAGVIIERHIASDVPAILGDATQVHQILMNLCTNAWRAIERRGITNGRIEIRLRSVMLNGQDVAHLPGALNAGEHVYLTVTDNGEGMDATTRSRIFEPFFTTRGVGEGTGLGLAVVYGIVAKHGGAILVDSAPGAGATFHLYFPVVGASAPETEVGADASPVTSLAHLAGRRVLYIDDEPQLVTLAQELLEEYGCTVSGYVDARAALKAFAAAPRSFDVLVSDYNMPALSGLDVARTARALAAQLPVIILSGRITDELTVEAERLGVAALLHKPDLVTALAPAIAHCLAVTQSARGLES